MPFVTSPPFYKRRNSELRAVVSTEFHVRIPRGSLVGVPLPLFSQGETQWGLNIGGSNVQKGAGKTDLPERTGVLELHPEVSTLLTRLRTASLETKLSKTVSFTVTWG